MAIIRYTLVCKDGEIRSDEEPHGGTWIGKLLEHSPKTETDPHGEKWVYLPSGKRKERGRYHITGPAYTFRYRLKRSLFLFSHIGFQRIWLESQPEPFKFDAELWAKLAAITSHSIDTLTDVDDTIERILRPPRLDFVMLLLVALAALGVGLALGGRFL